VAIGQEVQAIVVRALDAGVSALSLLPGKQEGSIWHHFGEAAQQVGSLPEERQYPLLARFKHMAKMNIGEQGWPQFGRSAFTYKAKDFDFRMTCLPSTYGDEILIHLSGRPPLKRILVRTQAGEERWMHLAEN
jgi:general secretion pathway protein E